MDKYKNQYRIQSARLNNWDYRWNASYFITICTRNREWFFGKVINGKMYLTEIGEYANRFLIDIPKHVSFVTIDCHIVMPNHIHAILTINNPTNIKRNRTLYCGTAKTLHCGTVETLHATSLQPQILKQLTVVNKNGLDGIINNKMSDLSPKSSSLSVILRSYKSAVTKNARKINVDFAWQSRFHDHIIRDSTAYKRIMKYILDNPLKWGRR